MSSILGFKNLLFSAFHIFLCMFWKTTKSPLADSQISLLSHGSSMEEQKLSSFFFLTIIGIIQIQLNYCYKRMILLTCADQQKLLGNSRADELKINLNNLFVIYVVKGLVELKDPHYQIKMRAKFL